MASPEEIVGALLSAFPEKQCIPPPERVEEVMRPFHPIAFATEEKIRLLLVQSERGDLGLRIGPWMEANYVVRNEGERLDWRIQFLLHDTCTCVLAHLPDAVRHSSTPVDARILALLEKHTS